MLTTRSPVFFLKIIGWEKEGESYPQGEIFVFNFNAFGCEKNYIHFPLDNTISCSINCLAYNIRYILLYLFNNLTVN